MAKKEIMILSNERPLTLAELCEICQVSSDTIFEFVAFEIIRPQGGGHIANWKFDLTQLSRLQTALRLQQDLEINLQGVAVILDLLDELHRLRQRAEVFERYFR